MGLFKFKFGKKEETKTEVKPEQAKGKEQDIIPPAPPRKASELDFLERNSKRSLFPYIDGLMGIDQAELQDSIKAIEKELISLSEEQENLVGDADATIKELDDKIARMELVAKQYERLAVFIDRKYISINFARKEFSIIRAYHAKNKERYQNLPKEIEKVEEEEAGTQEAPEKGGEIPQRPKFNK